MHTYAITAMSSIFYCVPFSLDGANGAGDGVKGQHLLALEWYIQGQIDEEKACNSAKHCPYFSEQL